MNVWVAYAGAGLVLVAIIAGVASFALNGGAVSAVWFSAGLAWVLQVLAFAGLVAVRDRAMLFMPAWLGGMGLRFLALGALAFAASRTMAFPLAPLLVSFVGFLFLLVLLEPVFLKRGSGTT